VAAERLSSAGAPEPRWIEDLGVRPVTARMMCDDGFDDGRSVLIEFATRDGKPHTLGVYIDHNMRGLVKDVFVAGPLAGVTKALASGDGIVLSELDLAEARARVERALDVLDHTISPAVDKDVDRLRAFMYARARLLPGGTVLPDEFDEVDEVEPSEREGLLADFLSAAEGERWRGDDDASHIVAMAIDFGADYNYGGPLRWSPVVVETFMTGWLAHKVRAEVDFFERVPEVLRDWVRYAGRRRGVEPAGVAQAVMIVGLYRQPMLDAVADPERWGAAKAFLIAAERAGMDLADADALKRVRRPLQRESGGVAL
jgi:hypothetical protein